MLILFDIDGTLLRSEGVGIASMRSAFEELFPGRGVDLDGIPIGGRLDTLIWFDAVSRRGLDTSPEAHESFRATYGRHLAARLSGTNGSAPRVVAMPGTRELVQLFGEDDRVTVGLLTGNYRETGRLKLEAAGFDFDAFRVGAFAGDGPDRRALTPIAMRRLREDLGRSVDPREVVVIGDTPFDIDCARHHGCRALGVATGHTSVDELSSCGADLAVADLADVTAIAEWIRGGG